MSAGAELNFEEVANPSPALQEALWKNLQTFSDSQLRNPSLAHTASVAIIAREGQRLVAGMLATIYIGGMNLQCLWIDESLRGHGLGKRLLDQAEHIARRHRCNVIFGHSFGFQAPGFYEKAGYEEFGRIPEYPPGYGCVFMRKLL